MGCATGFSQTVSIGGSFGEHAGLVVSLEVAPILHEHFAAPPPTVPLQPVPLQPDKGRGPPRYLGVQASASTGLILQPAIGVTWYAAGGIDLLPFLFESGTHVGFGAQVGYAAGARHGLLLAAPRLWFALPVGELAGAPLTVGGAVHCQLLVGELQRDASGCGPALLVSRVSL